MLWRCCCSCVFNLFYKSHFMFQFEIMIILKYNIQTETPQINKKWQKLCKKYLKLYFFISTCKQNMQEWNTIDQKSYNQYSQVLLPTVKRRRKKTQTISSWVAEGANSVQNIRSSLTQQNIHLFLEIFLFRQRDITFKGKLRLNCFREVFKIK